MPYLKLQNEKKLYEITEEKAIRFAGYLDKKLKIPISTFERLDWTRCEIIKDLPYNYNDYEIVYIKQQIEPPRHDYSRVCRTPEQQKRMNEVLDKMRKELTLKLGWKK